MEKKYFIWDSTCANLVLAGASKDGNDTKKTKRKVSKATKSKMYFPHKFMIYKFKDILNFNEQTSFQRCFERKTPGNQADSDVILLQDVKNLALYQLESPKMSRELVRFMHESLVDRFLRALLLYLQLYLATWDELGAKRAAAARRAPNPLAGGARLQRAGELRGLRCLLGREYACLLTFMSRGVIEAPGEHDLRIFEGLLQLAHRIAYIGLGRKHRDLIEVELHRLFKTEPYNTSKRKHLELGMECEVPHDEGWILYGSKLPPFSKILSCSPLPYEILNTNCDYRVLAAGLADLQSSDPRISYLENALLAKEQDLPRLGIKLGILGLPRQNFDSMLIPQLSEEERAVADEAAAEDDEAGADDYETLMPVCGSDLELDRPYPQPREAEETTAEEVLRKRSRRMWLAQARCDL